MAGLLTAGSLLSSCKVHRHARLVGGIAKQAVRAVLRTVKAYLVQKGELRTVETSTSGPICEEPCVPADYTKECWDDVEDFHQQKK